LCVIFRTANIHDTVAGGEVIRLAKEKNIRQLSEFALMQGIEKPLKNYAEKLGLKIDIQNVLKPEWEMPL